MTSIPRHRVVITGMGMVTPLGADLRTSWTSLIAGHSGTVPLSLFDVSECRCREAAVVYPLPPLPNLSPKKVSRMPRASRLAIPAAEAAMMAAGLLQQVRKADFRMPLVASTTGGGMDFGESFVRGLTAAQKHNLLFKAARYQPQQQTLDLQESFGMSGPSTILSNACAGGANALGHALDLIEGGHEECVLAGGFEALTELIFVGFDCLQATTTHRCVPFDEQRSGLVLGEGAAFFVLESEDHARSRGAHIVCCLSGYGHITDTHHLTQPSPDGSALVAAMEAAVRRAGISRSQVGYVNAHGTATATNDPAEVESYRRYFGEGLIPKISSTKAATGHTLGAAGAIEGAFAIQTLLTGNLPPQINTTRPLPGIAGRLAKLGERITQPFATMSTNLGFGGSNAALVFRRYDN